MHAISEINHQSDINEIKLLRICFRSTKVLALKLSVQHVRQDIQMERIFESTQTNGMRYRTTLCLQHLRQKIQT